MKQILYKAISAIILLLVFYNYVCAESQSLDSLALWAQPVTMSRVGVTSYFSQIFNQKGYGCYCIEHAVDFLEHVSVVSQPLVYISRIIDLFHIRAKEAEWINPHAALQLLTTLDKHISRLFCEAEQKRSDAVKQTLYKALLSRFTELKQNPEEFLCTISQEIVHTVDNAPIKQMQYKIVLFITTIMDKLIFSAYEQEEAWNVAQNIVTALETLHRHHIIADETALQGCYWSVLFRFINCIDISGEYFLRSTYHIMKRDLIDGSSPLFCSNIFDEQGVIKSRAEWFKEAIFSGEVRARVIHTK